MGKSGISRVAPIGKRFGKLEVVSGSRPGAHSGSSSVDCRCDCGDIRSYFIFNLSKMIDAMCPECRPVHRASKGCYRHPLFNIWKGMIQRCENPAHTFFARYGGRGISICPAWRNDFTRFADDMGERPSIAHTIDRIDPNGNYEPSNCRWLTISDQQGNRENAIVIEWRGERLSLKEASTKTGLEAATIAYRLRHGWSADRALTTPSQKKRTQS